nr:MATE family efflux transporter [Neptuniibacter sp.]
MKTLSEIKVILALGLPIAIAQIAQTSMGFVDTLMAGRYDSTDLAAVSLGSSIWLPVFIASQGILIATTPLVAHLVGADRPEETQKTLHQGTIISLILTVLAMALLHNCMPILMAMNVEPELANLTDQYLKAVSWGFPALLFYQLIRSYIEGFGKTQPAMKIAILGLICNIPLNYVLIYGRFGLPELGGVGCGWATAIVMWIMLFVAVVYILKTPDFKELKPFSRWQTPQLTALANYLKLGLPIGVSLLVEVSMFSVIALLLADLGEIMIASHQITLSFTGLVFMLPLSISMALTIRVGHQLGYGLPQAARFSAKTGLLITLTIAIFSSSLMALFAAEIADLYTTDTRILDIAASLILIAALFQFSDAIQITCSGTLRGYKDTLIPLLMVFIAYWLIGLPTGFVLGKTDILVPAMGPKGFWIGLLIGLSIGAILLLSRLHWKSR